MLNFIDFEVFKHDWLCVIKNPFEKTSARIVNDSDELVRYYESHKNEIFVGFNIRQYDQYIFKALLLGLDPEAVNDWIIVQKRDGWQFSRSFNSIPLILFDIMPNPPVSLKALEGFMGHNIKETDVPFDIDRPLTEDEIEQTFSYCDHDVDETIEVFMQRINEFNAQLALVKEFLLPLSYISKTQAQLAAIILEAEKVTFDDEWDIRVPETLVLNKYKHVADWFLNTENHNEKKKLECDIAGVPHVFAWGGVHGAKAKYHYECAPDEYLIMADVDQLYPTLMIMYGLLSRAVKKPEKFKYILDTSLRLKAEKKKKEREPYKRICNITYGAEGDKYNAMYDPLHRTLVCVFGQLLIIDLIEKIESFAELIQSNTDGILIKIKKKDFERLDDVVYEWEKRTHLHMSFDIFKSVMQKDVNNYVVVDFDGKTKAKGAYVKELSPIDYDLPILNRALNEYLVNGVPVERTIYECNDLKEFQKIVKLSSKYDYVEHNDIKYSYKCYRVFASKRSTDGQILKCKIGAGAKPLEWGASVPTGLDKKDKFANTPDHCFIDNDDVNGKVRPDYLDLYWYVELAKKRLEQFGV